MENWRKILCSACAHNMHLKHNVASEDEDCVCVFCTEISEGAAEFLERMF